MNNTCTFCTMWKQKTCEIVTQTKFFFIIYDKHPVTPGHMLIIPKRHCATIFELSAREQKNFWQALDLAKMWGDSGFHPDGYNLGINCGEAAGQTVFHAHVHLIPRRKGDVSNPHGGVRNLKEPFKPYPEAFRKPTRDEEDREHQKALERFESEGGPPAPFNQHKNLRS